MVQSLIINNNGTADDAKDIFQEAMIVLYEKARSGTFELSCQIKTYVYSVSRRLWLKKITAVQPLFRRYWKCRNDGSCRRRSGRASRRGR